MNVRILTLAAALAAAPLVALAGPAPAASVPNPLFSDDTAVVGYEPGADASVRDLVRELGGTVTGESRRMGFMVVATDDPAGFVDAMQGRPGVRYAERDPLVFPEHTPNDVSYSNQWGMRAIRADVAWDTEKGDGAVVAVLDTGVDWQHPDLLLNMWTNTADVPGNKVDDDGNGYVDDWIGWDFSSNDNDPDPGSCGDHGTHVAGIVAATQDNVLGVTGVAPQARIMALRTICASNHLSAAALAVDYAVQMGADVVTCSWFATYSLAAFEEVVRDAYANHDMIFVKSAGNQNGGPVTYPGTLPEYIAVSSLDSNLAISSFSSQGTKVELAAPGGSVYSTYNGAFGYLSGTSMAAPHVAGTAALLAAKNPALTNVQIRDLLAATATDLGAAGRDTRYGWGIVDAGDAVAGA